MIDFRFAVVEDDGTARTPTERELRLVAMAFLSGVCIGELWELGCSEEEIRQSVDLSIARLLESHGRKTQ